MLSHAAKRHPLKGASMSDLIAAIATGSIAAAIGIVRVSGDGCFAACDRVFRPRNGVPFAQQPSHKMVFGEMLDDSGAVIDQGLAVRFGGGHSYTGEDSAEFHCHGSPVVLGELLSALFAAGARQAKAGEFTRRAFLNGKMDLTEAEAVIDLIDAQSAAAAKNAAAQLDGGLRRRLEPVQEALIDITSRFYAVVDYPDEDIEDIQPQQIRFSLQIAADTLSALLDTAQRGRVLKNGVRTAIVGLPNAGKSSLLNALAGYDRAIVTDIPGTTRDTVEESIQLAGLALRLIDTAGVRESSDVIEQAGITRTNRALETADLVLEVADASTPRIQDFPAPVLTAPRLLILNKCDLGVHPDWKAVPGIRFSCATGEGRKELEEAIIQAFSSSLPGETGSSLVAINARHQHELGLCREHVRLASESISRQESPEFTALELREALTHLGEITGAVDTEDVLGAIFSSFCLGK